MRKLIGETDPRKAKKGTIRGDLAEGTTKNVIHASDSIKAAKQEVPLFFSKKELMK
jgi:nucleoside-diphosphate kinase